MKPTKQQIELAKRKTLFAWLIGILVFSSSATIFQVFYASDSIVEIRFSEDFFIDPDLFVQGFNVTSFSDENTSLSDVPFWIFQNLGFWFIDNDLIMRTLNQTQRVQFMYAGILFPRIVEELQTDLDNSLLTKSIGISNTNDSVKAGNVFKFRVPRNLHFFLALGTFGNEVNFHQDLADITAEEYYFSAGFHGIPSNHYSELTTGYEKMIITIHSLDFHLDQLEKLIANQNVTTNELDFEHLPTMPPYSLNISVSRGSGLPDILNPNIK